MQEDELKEQFWDAFKMVYSYEAQSFFTNDFNFHLKHFDICNLILSQKDVMKAWEEIDEMLQGSLHRLSVQYYGRQAMDLRSHIDFMWAVNLQILEYLYKEDVILALYMWNRFWSGGLAYARRFAAYQEDYVYQYLGRLISYYYVCFVKGESGIEEKETEINDVCMNKVMAKFKQIENMPILVLLSTRMLLNNGWAWQDIMNGKYKNFFVKAFARAIKLSVEQKKYEWVSLYLNKMGFGHK